MNLTLSNALIVEDELALADALKLSLNRMGISKTTHVTTIDSAKTLFSEKSENIDLVLLDRRLPDGDGLVFCKWLRSQHYTGSILVLTASGDTYSRVEGLDAGADDYLPKPFAWDELSARIRALSRRYVRKPAEENALAKDTLWYCNEDKLCIKGPKGWETLTPLEFNFAKMLITNHGKIITRDDLLKNVWGFKWLPQTRTIDYFLGRLRKRFEATPSRPAHFITVRGAGYKFEL